MKRCLPLVLLIIRQVFAVSASPQLLTLTQPDGSMIQCHLRGDECCSWHETPDGWSIVKDPSGYWVYATATDGTALVPGNRIVERDQPPTSDITGKPLTKHLRPEARQRIEYRPAFRLEAARTDTFRLPLLLVEYPDYRASYSDSTIDNIMNQVGYGHPGYPGSGSFRDFYGEISYGAFQPMTDVITWVTAPANHDYYGYSNGFNHVLSLVRAAVDSAEAHGMDWTVYDNDGDGYVDGLTLIHAGPGAEEGDYDNIWSHKWYLSAGGLDVVYDGVVIDGYSMNPEIQNNGIVAIGVICHEFGHTLGLPDLYDTDYSSDGAGRLALMAAGSWGTTGTTPWYPSAMTAWSKTELGWSDPVVLSADQLNVSLEQSYSNNIIYQIDHPSDDSEYWLIENRQKVGTDVYMPSAGLAIWHIDTEKTTGWAVNDDEPHYGVGLEQADGRFNLENNQGSDGGDPYPGTSDNHTFNNNSTPNTTSYYGAPSMIAIENISNADSLMTFDLSFGEILMADLELANASGPAYDTGSVTVALTNEMIIGTFRFRLQMTPSILDIIAITPTNRVTADSVILDNNLIEFVNPLIAAGSGPVVEIGLFANTGVATSVALSFTNVYSADTSGSEVALITTGATYTVNAVAQQLSVAADSAAAGGPFSYQVILDNSVPIKMIGFTLTDHPDYLTVSDELFTDTNGNDSWDEGEPFTDWNEDGTWTPALVLSERLAGWNHSLSATEDGVTFQAASWSSPVTVDSGALFTIHGMVDISAPVGSVVIAFDDLTLMDVFGNTGVSYNLTSGALAITPYVGVESPASQPVAFALSDNYPNPFNPRTTLHYEVPQEGSITFAIYDLRGALVRQVTRQQSAGRYTLEWDGTNQNGLPVTSGVYFLRMTAPGFTSAKKLLLLK